MKSNTIISKFADLADTVKAYFNDDTDNAEAKVEEVSAEEVTTTFAEVTTADGETVLSYEGEIAEGVAMFITTEEGEQVPAPEGSYELGGDMEGTTITLDADGIVVEVVSAEAEAEGEEVEAEEMSSENVDAKIDDKLSQLDAPLNALSEGIAKLIQRNKELESKFTEIEQKFEALKDTPSDKKEIKKKFSRNANDMNALQRQILAGLNKNK
jgi:hypothetical protein